MWDSEMVIILRHMIDDLAETPKYTDDRLMQLILTGAQFAQEENSFSVVYTIDIENFSLKPDPTARTARDNAFINLTLLRSACLLGSSGLAKVAAHSMSVREAGYGFDNRGAAAGKKFQVTTWCDAYKDARWEYISSNMV